MKRIKIANTNIESSQIIYGCMKIGGTWNDEPLSEDTINNAVNCIKTAVDCGIDYFDLADIYCRGKSEEAFSYIWDKLKIKRNNIIVQSKCGIRFPDIPYKGDPHRYDFSYEHIIYSVENILRRLKTDYLDVLLLHRPDPLVEPEEVAKAFDELKISGKVRYFGVSNHNAAQIELLKKYLKEPLIINQLELNIIHNHLIDAGVTVNNNVTRIHRGDNTLEYCRLNSITIQAWSPLAKGKLSAQKPDEGIPSSELITKILEDLSAKYNASSEAVLLEWIMRHPAKIQPVIGTSRPERITKSCKYNDFEMERTDWYRLFNAGRGNPLP